MLFARITLACAAVERGRNEYREDYGYRADCRSE
jgi:hypothetical protein